MKRGLAVGATATRRYGIDEARTIGFMGDALRVYATPEMVRDVENACRLFLEEYLDEGENTVGARVELDHLGPTLNGMWVEVRATVAAIEGRRVDFTVEVFDAVEQVGRGRHVRFVVDLARQRARLEAKAAKAKAADEE